MLITVRSIKAGIIFLIISLSFTSVAFCQRDWKLSKQRDGINVYEASVPNSGYKSIKVECTLEGTYDKLIAVLSNVSHQKDWVYNNKNSYLLKKISPNEFYYYSETFIPWPMSNRDAVVHLRISKDSLDRFLKVTGTGEPNYIPEKSGKVRVPKSLINWYVTMPTPKTISIVYTFEAEPGGSLPAWLVNMFADKGPYESFRKLAEILKQT